MKYMYFSYFGTRSRYEFVIFEITLQNDRYMCIQQMSYHLENVITAGNCSALYLYQLVACYTVSKKKQAGP